MTMKETISQIGVGAASLALAGSLAYAGIPERPEHIDFEKLEFQAPDASEYRATLSNGVAVYMAPSSEFPLIDISLSFKGGSYLEPEDMTGLASVTGQMIRRGGTTTKSPEQMDEEFDFLAANASAFIGGTTAGASLNALKSNFDEAFSLFMDMVRNPGFDEERLRIVKDELLESMKQRNDDANTILAMEWDRLMWGEEHFEGRAPTGDSITRITPDAMRDFHRKLFNPGNMIVAVTGDFQPAEMLSYLEGAFSDWPMGARMPDPPAPDHNIKPGVYHVEKDIPQGKFRLGHRGVKRDNPDYFPLTIMNDILGGGGFTSRMMKKIRSDEGLTYGISSSLQNRVYYPGQFVVNSFSKNDTVALTIKLALEQIENVQRDGVTEEELETSKQSFIETFPRRFESKAGMLNTFVSDEWTDRPSDYWKNYRKNVESISTDDVKRVANEYLNPDQMMILVVGKWDEIYEGDIDQRASMADFFGGEVTHNPLRDPVTMEPMPETAAGGN